ncbi:MAG: hypothetical protein U0W40_07720 [Acidimicrobiia bacterium]
MPKTAHVFGVEIPLLRIYMLNPLVRMFQSYRAVLYDLRFPPLFDLGYIIVWAVAMFPCSHTWIFSKFLDRRLK